MKKWGLGIEHEMRIRFKNNISELPKNVQDTLFPSFKNEYIFIESNTLLYYFKMHEMFLMNNFEKYIINEDEKVYLKKLSLKKVLLEKAKNKINFPLEDKSFFDINNGTKKIEDSLELLSFYLNIFTLFHAPLLFFEYNFNNEVRMNLNILLNYDKIVDLIYHEEDKNISMELLKTSLSNLYNDTHEKYVLNYFKKIFEKKNIKDFIFSNINIYKINIDIIFVNNSDNNTYTNKFDINKFFTKIEKYILKMKDIFNNTIEIQGIDNYKFYKNLFTLYHYKIPEIDRTYQTNAIEFKTINYDSNNYEKTLDDLIELEKTFFFIINNLPIIKTINEMFGELIYHNIGSVKNSISVYDIININYDTIQEDYTGSYHLWITAPYSNNTTVKRFINIHSTLANKLQLLEPILAAHYSSPSYNTFGNNSISKSSLRQFLNEYSNYGTTDVSLMNGTKKHSIRGYYLSEEDILNKNPSFYPTNIESSIYDMKGNLIINYNKLNTRYITNSLFKFIDKGNEESKDINIQNYFSLIFEKTKIRPKIMHKLGADIRTRDLSEYNYPLDKNWERCLLMKKNKLHEIYYNKKINKISYERIYDKDIYKNTLMNRIGFEFRIFDHFPTNYLNQILALLVPIVLDSVKNPKIIKFKNTYVAKQFWHDEMFHVITKGYEYTLGLPYIKILEKEFGVVLKHKKSLNSEDILKELYENLCKKYNKSYKNSLYKKMCFTSEIKFMNFNKKAWFEIINKYFEENPEKLKKILYHNKDLNNNNILEILGKKYNYNLDKIKNYLINYEK